MAIKLEELKPVKETLEIKGKNYIAQGWTLEAMHYITNQYKGGLKAFYEQLGKGSPKDLLHGFYAILRCDNEFLKDFPTFEDFKAIKYHFSIADYLIKAINNAVPTKAKKEVKNKNLKKKILTLTVTAIIIFAGLLFMIL